MTTQTPRKLHDSECEGSTGLCCCSYRRELAASQRAQIKWGEQNLELTEKLAAADAELEIRQAKIMRQKADIAAANERLERLRGLAKASMIIHALDKIPVGADVALRAELEKNESA